MDKNNLYKLLKFVALFGNIIFMLWIAFNGMNEGFKSTPPQIASYIGLTLLLALNSFLLYNKKA